MVLAPGPRARALGLSRLTTLAYCNLTDVSFGRAMCLGKPGREASDGDVPCQEVKLLDAVERLGLWRELRGGGHQKWVESTWQK